MFSSENIKNLNYSPEMRNSLTTTLIIIFVYLFGYFLWNRRKLYYASYQLPGPMALPLLGNLHNLVGMGNTGEDIFNTLFALYNKYGSTFRFWAGPKFFIMISKPEDLETIYTNPNCFHKDLLVMKVMKSALGNGLLTSEVPLWKVHRKLINPTFNQKILNGFFDKFLYHGKKINNNLKLKVGNGKFDIFPFAYDAAVRLIYETSLGGDVNSFSNLYETLTKYLDETMDIAFQRMAKPWLYFDTVFNLTKQGRTFKKNMSYLSSVSEVIIQKKQEEKSLKTNTNTTNNNVKKKDLDDDIKIPEKKVFIDLLMECHENGICFTEKELTDQINTFVVAGSHTIATTINFVCLLLGTDPECQEKVYAEIQEVLGESDRDLTIEDLSQLKCLERVIKETLRIFPVLPFLVRLLKKDVQFADFVAPAGTTVLFTNFLTQRDPKVWPNPLKFDPDRFLPEEISKQHPYGYVPFGGGPHLCIGYRYAMMAMKVLLSTTIRKYRFKSNFDINNVRLTVEIITKTAEVHLVEIELRN